jgi:hypothetical protein
MKTLQCPFSDEAVIKSVYLDPYEFESPLGDDMIDLDDED